MSDDLELTDTEIGLVQAVQGLIDILLRARATTPANLDALFARQAAEHIGAGRIKAAAVAELMRKDATEPRRAAYLAALAAKVAGTA